jgi:hypothetical protein
MEFNIDLLKGGYYKLKSLVVPKAQPDVVYDISRGVAYDPSSELGKEIEKTDKFTKLDASSISPSGTRGLKTTQLKDIELPSTPKIQETYDPRLGMYISTRPEYQFGTSVVTRQPTRDESQRIREAEIRGGIFDRPTGEIVSDVKEYKRNIEKYKQLTDEFEEVGKEELETLEKLSEKIDEEGYFTGTEKELKEYNKAVEDYEKKIGEAKKEIEKTGAEVQIEGEQLFFKPPEPETIRVGFPFTLKEETASTLYEVPITKFTATTETGLFGQAVSSGLGVLTEEAMKGTGEIASVWAGIPYKITGKEEFTSPRYFGEKIGEIIKQPSLLKSYFKEPPKPDVV